MESRLINNRVLDQLVIIFVKYRPVLLEKIRSSIVSIEYEHEKHTVQRAKMIEPVGITRERDIVEERSDAECFLDSKDRSFLISMIDSKKQIETGRTLFWITFCLLSLHI